MQGSSRHFKFGRFGCSTMNTTFLQPVWRHSSLIWRHNCFRQSVLRRLLANIKVFQLIKSRYTSSKMDSLEIRNQKRPSSIFTVPKPKSQQTLPCDHSQEAHRQKVQRQPSIVFPSFHRKKQVSRSKKKTKTRCRQTIHRCSLQRWNRFSTTHSCRCWIQWMSQNSPTRSVWESGRACLRVWSRKKVPLPAGLGILL